MYIGDGGAGMSVPALARCGGVTSPHPPRCSSRGPYRRRDRGPGICAACPGRTPWRWSRSPSSLSSFSVFGLPGPLETVGGQDVRLHTELFIQPPIPIWLNSTSSGFQLQVCKDGQSKGLCIACKNTPPFQGRIQENNLI